MNRLTATLKLDVTVQARYGFYIASLFFALVWVTLLRPLPLDGALKAAVPAIIGMNLLITTFYFAAGLVLLEKSQATLGAVAVSPLRPAEYLAARTITLSLLAAAETLVVVLLAYGLPERVPLVLAGTLLLGAFYALAGVASVERHRDMSTYLLPSVAVAAFFVLPLVGYVWPHPLWALHPVQPMLTLINAGFFDTSAAQVAYGLLGAVAWVAVSAGAARRAYGRILLEAAA